MRFIAISAVVLFHLNRLFIEKNTNQYAVDFYAESWLSRYLAYGDFGVEFFFAISGFILGLPFAKAYLANGKAIDIKAFFLKRLTRLEPPYILIMVALFFANVYIVNSLSFQEGIKSLFSSIFYIHNFVYGKDTYPLLNSVAWSLEIEVQFYLLAPLLGLIFKIPKRIWRFSFILISIVFFTFLTKLNDIPFISLMDFWGFFAVGFLLADLYIKKPRISIPNSWFVNLLTFVLLFFVFLLRKVNTTPMNYAMTILLQLVMIFVIYYNVLFVGCFDFLRKKIVTNIGGMCYTIYLLHGVVFSIFGHALLQLKFTDYQMANNLIYSILLISITLLISGIFFVLIERPCMNKNWPKQLVAWFKNQTVSKSIKV